MLVCLFIARSNKSFWSLIISLVSVKLADGIHFAEFLVMYRTMIYLWIEIDFSI